MSENSFKSIRNGTIASVTGAIVLLVVPTLREYFFSILSWFWSVAVWCWEALVSSHALPGWALLVISIFALVGLIKTYQTIKGESEEPEFRSYVECMMYGAKWQWVWVGNSISNVSGYCPRCSATLVYDDSSCRSCLSENKTEFICENCSHCVVATISGGNKNYAIGAVTREIDRRIRTGEYKDR